MHIAFDTPTISLLLFGACGVGLQIWWIAALVRRNRSRRFSAPLSSKDFRAELERIFRNES